MIKCEITDKFAQVEVAGNLADIETDVTILVSTIYQKLKKNTSNPIMATLFKDGIKKAFESDVPFENIFEDKTIMSDVKKSADDLLNFIDGFADYIKNRRKPNDESRED